jgi:hypothetical protein
MVEMPAADAAPNAMRAPTADPAPERLLLVPVLAGEDGGQAGPRYVLVRWADWPYPALLSLAPPGPFDRLEDAVTDMLRARLQLEVTGPPRLTDRRVPVRMGAPRFGFTGTGWLRAVVVPVRGEPQPDALLAGVDVLPLDEALAALTTEVERMILRDAAGASAH